ncbi:PrsW family glutamic-type intramembrane protease, partial [Streptococcus suis]
EELSKGFAVLLVVLLCRRLNLKQGLTIGIIVGVGFEIVEDVIYVFQSVFQFHESGFATAIDRVASATVSHWLFASLFA